MFQPCRLLCLLAVFGFTLLTLAEANAGDALTLRLVPIRQGIRVSAFGDQPDRFRSTAVYQAANVSGVDLTNPSHPLVICSCDGRRMFYLFYNLVTDFYEWGWGQVGIGFVSVAFFGGLLAHLCSMLTIAF